MKRAINSKAVVITIIVFLYFIMGFSNRSTAQNSSIVGTWVSEEDSLWVMVFKENNLCYNYYEGKLTSSHVYLVSRTFPQCPDTFAVGNNSTFLQLKNTKDANDLVCYEVNGISSKYLSITPIGRGGAIIFVRDFHGLEKGNLTSSNYDAGSLINQGTRRFVYKPLAEFNGDTLNYIRYNFIANKSLYIGQPASLLFDHLEPELKSYLFSLKMSDDTGFDLLKGSYLSFLEEDETECRSSDNRKNVELIITFKNYLPMESLMGLYTDRRPTGAWTPQVKTLFGSQVISDVEYIAYPRYCDSYSPYYDAVKCAEARCDPQSAEYDPAKCINSIVSADGNGKSAPAPSVSFNTNKQIVAFTGSDKNFSIELPKSAKSTSIESIAESGSRFAANMSTEIKQFWNGYSDDNFNILIMWRKIGSYSDIYQEKGAIETASQRSKNVLISELKDVNGKTFYINAWKNEAYRIKASTYFGRESFALVIECKEKDFPEAQKKLMEMIESLKVE